jgi:hypothetical protein
MNPISTSQVKVSAIMTVILAVVSLLPLAWVQAETEWAQATIQKQLDRKCKDGMPRSKAVYQSALTDARIAAIRSWGSQKSAATSNLLASAEAEIKSSLDTYLLSPVILTKCKQKTFQLSFRAEVNVAAMDRLMAKNAPAVTAPRSRMTAVFLARKQAGVKIFDEKITKISQQTSISEAEQSADVAGETMSATGVSTTTEKAVTGGNTERKANKVLYEVFNSGSLDAAVIENFSSYGFRVVDAAQVAGRFEGFDLNAFREEFGVGDDLSPETKNAAFDAIRGRIPLLVVATVDVLGSQIDDVSGNYVVYASVKAWVYRDDGLFFEAVAAVAPSQMRGDGPNETVAETDALKKAAASASREIVDQLNAAGIR